MTQIISIEGNIGSGKSTLVENLREFYKDNSNVKFVDEPVKDWNNITDENDITILEKFYADQTKYSFSFQIMAYISRLAILKKTIEENPTAIIITERFLYTDREVFAKMLFDNKNIELINYKIYLKWFDTFALDFPITQVIYVKTSPEICFNRINKRSRTGENNIPLQYLENCHLYHNNMLDKSSNSCFCTNQLVLNGSIDIYENKQQLDIWLNEINDFIINSIILDV